MDILQRKQKGTARYSPPKQAGLVLSENRNPTGLRRVLVLLDGLFRIFREYATSCLDESCKDLQRYLLFGQGLLERRVTDPHRPSESIPKTKVTLGSRVNAMT